VSAGRATGALAAGVLAAGAWILVGCDWSAQRMVDQERCERDEPTNLFSDGNCNRTPPAGVVPWRGAAPADGVAGAAPVTPPPRTRALVARGRDRYQIFCAPCHGLVGDGRSQVAENMLLRPPPSLHEPRIAALADTRVFDVITGGYGLMPAYRAQLAAADRWAVVAYVRVLERSQDTALDRLPPAVQEEAKPWLR
jgi:mono/diheme cytochrome c family protein